MKKKLSEKLKFLYRELGIQYLLWNIKTVDDIPMHYPIHMGYNEMDQNFLKRKFLQTSKN